ncbi:MAG TPA: MotA/TolQ/ExbB proton channel family protein, partial [Candidatus Sulfotelmatobacter sp.]
MQRIDLFALALMLVYVVIVLSHVSYKYRSARRVEDADTEMFHRRRRKLAADLSGEVSSLKSVAFAAPYLGLAGTCVGILGIFRGYSGSMHGALVMVATAMAAALTSAAAGVIV